MSGGSTSWPAGWLKHLRSERPAFSKVGGVCQVGDRAFNILYGTMPMMWANQEGAWMKNRELFLRTCRNTCKLHEVHEVQVGGARHLLPQNGFAVKGPKIEQSLELVNGKAVTCIRTASYRFTE
jgi:hypothetical protein